VKKNIKIGLNKKQKLAMGYLLDNKTSSIGYGGAAGGGKSFLGCFWIIMMCLNFPGTRWCIGRKRLSDLKDSTLITFWQVLGMAGMGVEDVVYNKIEKTINFANGSEIILRNLENQPSDPTYQRLGGLELNGAFIDESAEVPERGVAVLSSRVGRWNAGYGLHPKVLETFNPDRGHVYSRFHIPEKKGELPENRVFIRALIKDNPKLTEAYKKNLLENSTKADVERLFFGNFDYEDDPNIMIQRNVASDLFTNELDVSGNRHMAVDVAGKGEDCFVIAIFEGAKLLELFWEKTTDAPEVVSLIRKKAKEWKVGYSQIVVDADGIGFVHGFLPGVYAFHGGGRQLKSPQKFKNLRSQCYFKLAKMANNLEIDLCNVPKDIRSRVLDELTCFKQKNANSDQKIEVSSKKEMKELNRGRSPDFSDALMMSMVYHLRKKVDFKSAGEIRLGFM